MTIQTVRFTSFLLDYFRFFQITLSFESFHTEYYYDFCYIYDGDSVDASLLSLRHGNLAEPPTEVSSGSFMFIRFTSNSWSTRTGFSASVTFNGK